VIDLHIAAIDVTPISKQIGKSMYFTAMVANPSDDLLYFAILHSIGKDGVYWYDESVVIDGRSAWMNINGVYPNPGIPYTRVMRIPISGQLVPPSGSSAQWDVRVIIANREDHNIIYAQEIVPNVLTITN
jgi:hypothetical protein